VNIKPAFLKYKTRRFVSTINFKKSSNTTTLITVNKYNREDGKPFTQQLVYRWNKTGAAGN
jgi:phage regulator Rha-like protein